MRKTCQWKTPSRSSFPFQNLEKLIIIDVQLHEDGYVYPPDPQSGLLGFLLETFQQRSKAGLQLSKLKIYKAHDFEPDVDFDWLAELTKRSLSIQMVLLEQLRLRNSL